MRDLDRELQQSGAEFRQAGGGLADHPWDKTEAGRRSRRQLMVAIAAATAIVGIGALSLLALEQEPSPDVSAIGESAAAAKSSEGGQGAPASKETTPGEDSSASTPLPPMEFEDPPHLILETEGWDLKSYSEETYEPYRSGTPLVFRPPTERLDGPTLVVERFEVTETQGWSAGEGAEQIKLDGRTVSIMDAAVLPLGHGAGVEFDDGTLVVLAGFALDRADFVEAARSVTLDPSGSPVVIPPPGFSPVDLPPYFEEKVTYRQGAYSGPDGADAEVRIWSGTAADLEQDSLSRAMEATVVRGTTIDGVEGLIANHSNDGSRFFVVGGDDGFVIEVDVSARQGAGMSDADLDAIVAGAVICAWLDQWIDATATGDADGAQEAVAGLATSRDWAILIEMEAQGGFAQVVWEYADAIAGDGTITGGKTSTVTETYQQVLGCVPE